MLCGIRRGAAVPVAELREWTLRINRPGTRQNESVNALLAHTADEIAIAEESTKDRDAAE
jgi:hypothetical protein